MVFNHDAWMEHSAKRQMVVEEAAREAHDFVDRQNFVGDNEVYIRLSIAILDIIARRQEKRPADPKLDEILKRKAEEFCAQLAGASKSEYESDALALALARQLLASGTNQILSDLGMWESKTFREGGRVFT